MTKKSSCCFTGHRAIKAAEVESIHEALQQQILTAIQEGYTRFLCGMANGADLLFAQVVAELKQQYPITLEAAIPYQVRLQSNNPIFRQLLPACDVVKVHSPVYHGGCYQKRNRYMVDESSASSPSTTERNREVPMRLCNMPVSRTYPFSSFHVKNDPPCGNHPQGGFHHLQSFYRYKFISTAS